MALLQMSTNKQAQAETQTCQLDIKLENTLLFVMLDTLGFTVGIYK